MASTHQEGAVGERGEEQWGVGGEEGLAAGEEGEWEEEEGVGLRTHHVSSRMDLQVRPQLFQGLSPLGQVHTSTCT